MTGEFHFLTPSDVPEALRLLKDRAGHAQPIAGGARLVAEMRQGGTAPAFLLDLSDLGKLRFRYRGSRRFHIGPTVRLQDLASWAVLGRDARALAEAAASVVPAAIRRQGTLGGNLLQRSPTGDCATALMALDARLRLASGKTERDLSIDRTWDENGRSAVGQDELLTDVGFNPADARTESAFHKEGTRSALRPAEYVLALRVSLSPSGQVVHDLRIAAQVDGIGPRRALKAEKAAAGQRISEARVDEIMRWAAEEVAPGSSMARHCNGIHADLERMLHECVARARVKIEDQKPFRPAFAASGSLPDAPASAGKAAPPPGGAAAPPEAVPA